MTDQEKKKALLKALVKYLHVEMRFKYLEKIIDAVRYHAHLKRCISEFKNNSSKKERKTGEIFADMVGSHSCHKSMDALCDIVLKYDNCRFDYIHAALNDCDFSKCDVQFIEIENEYSKAINSAKKYALWIPKEDWKIIRDLKRRKKIKSIPRFTSIAVQGFYEKLISDYKTA